MILPFLLISCRDSIMVVAWCRQTASNYPIPSYIDVIMSAMASQITGVSSICSTVCSGADQSSKLRVTGLCEVNLAVTGGFHSQRARDAEKNPFDDVIMKDNDIDITFGMFLFSLRTKLKSYSPPLLALMNYRKWKLYSSYMKWFQHTRRGRKQIFVLPEMISNRLAIIPTPLIGQ